MEEIYVNVDRVKPVESRPPHHTGPRSSDRRRHGAAVLCLGLLSVSLLAGLIGLAVLYHNSAANLCTMTGPDANLTELLSVSEERDLLNVSLAERTAELLSVSEERDLLNISLAERTAELQQLQRLLQLLTQKKTCPAGWMMFSFTCYLFSSESDSWEKGRQHCRDQGADLVIIDTPEEQKLLTELISQEFWIGLNDRDNEGTWKWIDGTSLDKAYWTSNQPDNGGGDPRCGEEDCAHIIAAEPGANWNDVRCDKSQQWICEKMAS